MSDPSEGDERKVESTSRIWAESQPGPSRCQASRQGYCGYCRVLYSNLDQHLSSLRHLDSVRASSRGSNTVSSSASSSRTKLTLLERFLQDVLQHHPHRYSDPRPSHADLPSVYDPPLPRAELDDFFSDDDSRSLGTQEHLSSSEEPSCWTANQIEAVHTHSQSGEGVTEDEGQRSLSAPIREQEGGGAVSRHTQLSQVQTPPPQHQAPLPVHRKAHRKTNRRKTSSCSTSPPHRGPGPGSRTPTELRPCPNPSKFSGPGPGPRPCRGPGPWLSWQKERREARKEEAFSSDHSDSLDRTIEEVIQRCCHGVTPCQQEETESFHFSFLNSMETQSDDWDAPVQRDATPFQVSPAERQDLRRLMDTQVDLEDQVYSHQLDSALHSKQQARGGARQEKGFWTLPIEEVLPAPQHIPKSFRGKTWTQIEQEDEEKVEKLVRQFRQQRFICYFDSESLARYGRRSQNKEVEPDTCALPLLDHDDDDSAYIRRRRRRAFRVASRCQVRMMDSLQSLPVVSKMSSSVCLLPQVVKVSHSTQTVHLVVPAVRQPASGAPPTSIPDTNQDAAETPEVQTWRCLPPSYSNIVTPLQSRTSLVYLLCSPSGPASTCTPAPGSAHKRCRKKRRPLDPQGVKVKYKQLPVRFYDPSNNRILKNPPKGFLWRQGLVPSGPPPPCVRQLFRSLSPDLNADRPLGEGAAGSSRVKGQRSSHSFLLNTLSQDSAQTDKQRTFRRQSRTSQAPPPPPHSRSERGSVVRRTRPSPSKRRPRAQATPPQPRREGLRRAGPGKTGSIDRRGRGRRGRR